MVFGFKSGNFSGINVEFSCSTAATLRSDKNTATTSGQFLRTKTGIQDGFVNDFQKDFMFKIVYFILLWVDFKKERIEFIDFR